MLNHGFRSPLRWCVALAAMLALVASPASAQSLKALKKYRKLDQALQQSVARGDTFVRVIIRFDETARAGLKKRLARYGAVVQRDHRTISALSTSVPVVA